MIKKFRVYAQEGKRWVRMSKSMSESLANKVKKQMQRHKPYQKQGLHNYKVGTKILKKWKKK